MSYAIHVRLAARYAALALTAPNTPPGDLPQLFVLRDDYAAALAWLVARLADLHRIGTRPASVAALVGDPVGALAAGLHGLPGLGPGWEQRPPPTERWAGRPGDPGDALSVVQTWKGLAVQAVLADDSLHRSRARLGGAERWTALGDIAVLAEALAALDPPLITAAQLTPEQTAAGLRAAAALGVAAREVACLAAGVRADATTEGWPRIGCRVLPVSRPSELPAATSNLAQLLRDEMTPLGAAAVHGAGLALARASLAAAGALDSAAQLPQASTSELLLTAAEALRRHGSRLRHAMETSRPRLATLDPGSLAVRQQAREIGTIAEGRLRDLIPRPAQALATSPSLLEYAARVGDATDALGQAAKKLDQNGTLLARDRTENPVACGWIATNRNGAADSLLAEIRAAAAAARIAPPAPRGWVAAPQVALEGPIVDLRHALARRRVAARPSRPSLSAAPGRGTAISWP